MIESLYSRMQWADVYWIAAAPTYPVNDSHIKIMARAVIGLCTLELYLPGMGSLKDKRSVLKSMLARLHNTFNVSAAEIDQHDTWQSAVIAIVLVSNSGKHTQQVMAKVVKWVEDTFPDVMITNETIEVI